MVIYRRLSPSSVRCLWTAIKTLTSFDSDRVQHAKLINKLFEYEFTSDNVENVLKYAIKEGLIRKITLTVKDSNTVTFYQIPSIAEIEFSGPDWYCYECHSSGNVVVCQTPGCNHVFHKHCIKSDEMKDQQWSECNYHKNVVSKPKSQPSAKNRQRAFSVCSDSSMSSEQSDHIFDSIAADDELKRYCYACRLELKAKKSEVAVINCEEINYLLKFVFGRVMSWLPDDIYTPSDISTCGEMVKQNIELSVNFLTRFKITRETVLNKLNANQYQSYEEFLRDLLDIVHNLAVVFGKLSGECEAAKYLFVDALYEINEIKRCADCYRRSNEKDSPNWFALPCSPPHALVYAKFANYPYWPAKVIAKNNDKYDVRFFGGSHDRATVSGRNIQEITANLKALNGNANNSGTLKAALAEFEEHKRLLQSSPNQFTFSVETGLQKQKSASLMVKAKRKIKTDRSETSTGSKTTKAQSLIQSVNSESENDALRIHLHSDKEEPTNGSKRKKHSNENSSELMFSQTSQDHDCNSSSIEGSISPTVPISPRIKSVLAKPTNGLKTVEKRLEEASSIEDVKQIALNEIKLWQNRLQKMKELHKEKLAAVKRKQWCIVCLKEANYFCCWNSSYCSKECQATHWIADHKLRCKRTR